MCTKNGKCIIPTVFDYITIQDRESERDYIPYIQVTKKINDVSYEGVYDLNGKEIIPAFKVVFSDGEFSLDYAGEE